MSDWQKAKLKSWSQVQLESEKIVSDNESRDQVLSGYMVYHSIAGMYLFVKGIDIKFFDCIINILKKNSAGAGKTYRIIYDGKPYDGGMRFPVYDCWLEWIGEAPSYFENELFEL